MKLFNHLFFPLVGLLIFLLLAGLASGECYDYTETYKGHSVMVEICWDAPPNPFSDGDTYKVWCTSGELYVSTTGSEFDCNEYGCTAWKPGTTTYTKVLGSYDKSIYSVCWKKQTWSDGYWVYAYAYHQEDLEYDPGTTNDPADPGDPSGMNVPGEKKTLWQWIISLLDIDFFQYLLNKLGLASLYDGSIIYHGGGGGGGIK